MLLQVFAIEFITFANDFIPFAVVADVAEEAVTEKLFTTVILQQDHRSAVTSYFCVPAASSLVTDEILCK